MSEYRRREQSITLGPLHEQLDEQDRAAPSPRRSC